MDMKTIRLFFLLFLLLLGGCSAPDQPSISLYLAVQRGDVDQIERHIYWGSDIDQLDPDGNRALHVAASQGRQIIVQILLKHGADTNLPDQADHKPLYYALLAGRTQLAELLVTNGAQFDADQLLLAMAVASVSDRDVIRYLVKQGANLETIDNTGQTALVIAVTHDNHRLLRHLIDQGADVNARSADGHSALWIANQLKLGDIAHPLKRNGAREE